MTSNLPAELKHSQKVATEAMLRKISLVSIQADKSLNFPGESGDYLLGISLEVEVFTGEAEGCHLVVLLTAGVKANPSAEDPESKEQGDEQNGPATARSVEEESTQTAVDVKIGFLLEYELKRKVEDYSEEEIKWFSNINAILNGWPYVRETVQNVSCRMGIRPITLDLLTAKHLLKLSDRSGKTKG